MGLKLVEMVSDTVGVFCFRRWKPVQQFDWEVLT
jgi:hypothetical protein